MQSTQQGIYMPLTDSRLIGYTPHDIQNQDVFDAKMRHQYQLSQHNFGWSGFGERRKYFFTCLGYSQMVQEERYVHLGIDIWIPAGTVLVSACNGQVVESGYEDGEGNYGGYVIVQYGDIFCFYGHLHRHFPPFVGTIGDGERIGIIGDRSTNGGYFEHLHFQTLTKEGFEQGYAHKGYETEEKFLTISQYVSNPENFLQYVIYK